MNCESSMFSAILLESEYSNLLFNQIRNNFSCKKLDQQIPAIAHFYTKLNENINTEPQNVYLFIEKDTMYCEFPQLKEILTDNVRFNADKDGFKTLLREFITEELLKNIENISDTTIEHLKVLEIDEKTIQTITDKINEVKSKGNLDKLKHELSDLFDKLMKCIQMSVRTNEITIDETLQIRKDSVYKLLADSQDLESLLQPILQTLKNKSNIIFTIHRNELTALNSKREIDPIGSRLYLAIRIIRRVFDDKEESALDPILNTLSKLFMDSWISDLQAPFNHLLTLHNELFALSWLSNHFISLQVTFEDSELVLNALGHQVQDLKTKYSSQAALLSGLFQAQQVPSPQLKSSDIPETKTAQLLPHFIPI